MRDLEGRTVVDVRSPGEYNKGHIPGAFNVPLFDDEERAKVGTTYKQVGKCAAVALGLEIAEQKADELCAMQPSLVYCWRGGMRSYSVHLFLQAARVLCQTLPGGYKAFRRWVLSTLEKERTFKVLGGRTGAGKTEKLRGCKEHVLDLEQLAHHRGSSFGGYDTPQPTQEQFENRLAWELAKLGDGPIWVEDESRMIGKLKLPDTLWRQMQKAPLTVLETSLEERIARLITEYGQLPKETLMEATIRLEKRLGSERTRSALSAIASNDYLTAVQAILPYYDKAYDRSIEARRKQ